MDDSQPLHPAIRGLKAVCRCKLSKAAVIKLMLEEPNLIRRPLVLAKGKAVFGYKLEEYERLAKK